MKLYKKGKGDTYTLGVFPTIELLKHRPGQVKRVVVSDTIADNRGWPVIQELCADNHIPIDTHEATIQKLSPKGNCYAVGILKTYNDELQEGSHVVLVHPMDMGNLGTIMRTMLGFGYHDLAMIGPCCDKDDPKVLRASMGAVFSLRVKKYDSFEAYQAEWGHHAMYPFMLKGAVNLQSVTPESPHSLIFGNESSGLDDSYLDVGQSVFIAHSHDIDSLNLSESIGIALYQCSKDTFKDATSL